MIKSLWLAIYLPRLALDVFGPQERLAAAVENRHIVMPSALAEAAGIHCGMKLATALGLAPDIVILERKPDFETAALNELACWAGHFTPVLSVIPPDTLLLEIGCCIRLFGGLDRLSSEIIRQADGFGYKYQTAVAPTARGAEWLARSMPGSRFVDQEAFLRVLQTLPIAAIRPTQTHFAKLESYGLKTIGELLALPSASLKIRLGEEFALHLAQASNQAPDLRKNYVFPEQFEQKLALPFMVEQTEPLFFGARRLILALCGWLVQRKQGVLCCELDLSSKNLQVNRIQLRFSDPVVQVGRIERVLRERLQREVLQAPVDGMSLRVVQSATLSDVNIALFEEKQGETTAGEIVERLRARLGDPNVFFLQTIADHRPENASRTSIYTTESVPPLRAQRPLWLFDKPRPIREVNGRPYHEQALYLLTSPEHIESGWWDGGEQGATGDIRRDYFIARGGEGPFLWIYRDRNSWWLHGVFG